MEQEGIDGGLVGGASLKPEDFYQLPEMELRPNRKLMILNNHTYLIDRKGFVLPFVLAFAMIILIFAFSLIFMAQTEYKLINKFVDYSIAEQIAESGVEQALFYLKVTWKLIVRC